MITLLQIALAIVLFYIVNWIGARIKPLDFGYVQMSVTLEDDTAPLFNYIFKVLAPIVYIILLVALFQSLGWDCLDKDVYWIVVYYWIFRLLYVTVRGQLPLLNWKLQFFYWASSIGMAVWVSSMIDKMSTILPSPQNLLEELWILIIIFLYSILNKLEFPRVGAEKRIKKYTYRKTDYFMARFGTIVNDHFSHDFFKAIVYAIMVYEDFNRPVPARMIERVLYRYSRKPHTYGIMQMTSRVPLSDEQSLIQACGKIKKDAETILSKEYFAEKNEVPLSDVSYGIFRLYNPGSLEYTEQVSQVYTNIIEKYFHNMPQELSMAELKRNL